MKVLVHSGGGNKGAWSSGVIQYLLGDLGLSYDGFVGTSVGAINVALLSMFKTGEEKEAADTLKELWLQLDNSKLYRHWPFWGRIAAIWRNSFFDVSPLHNLIRENISLERIRASGKKVVVGAVNIHRGKYETFTQDDDCFVDAVLASSAFPAFFSPIKINNDFYVDGGIKKLSNIKSAVDLGATEIDVITTSPEIRDKKFIENPNIIDIIRRILDISTDKILSNDIELAETYNKLARAGLSDKKPVKLRILRPHYNLVDNVLDFDPVIIKEMMQQGYEDAKRIYTVE